MSFRDTIDYYNTNALQFAENTFAVDFMKTQIHFLKKMNKDALILDFGCGSGRDTKYFLEQGYMVEAIDGSEELCKIAHVNTGIQIKNMMFQELAEKELYDGIWACSSILHLPINALYDVMQKMVIALKVKGIIYTSFKYGDFEGEKDGRYFTDMTEEKIRRLLETIGSLSLEEQWITPDVRPGRGEEKWLNIILRKK